MERVDKTVFLSYRRTNSPWALAIYQSLTSHGFDVFFDYNGIASGDFEKVILGNITARAHFLVLLTPSALERCHEPEDWLYREIEAALENQRNVVPIMLEGFDFGGRGIAGQLTGKIAALQKYNALEVPAAYFEAAMERLRGRFLNVPLSAVLHPASPFAQQAATEQKHAADAAPAVQENELTAQQWFELGVVANDLDEKIRFNSEAIRLKPDSADAFYNRAIARNATGDVEGAVKDYHEAIRLSPDFAEAFRNRGTQLGTFFTGAATGVLGVDVFHNREKQEGTPVAPPFKGIKPMITKIGGKFLVTIPPEIRNLYELQVGDLLEWSFDRQTAQLVIRPKRAQPLTPKVEREIADIKAERRRGKHRTTTAE